MKKILHMVPKGSMILTITSAISYALGLIRDRFFAQTFGASRDLDAYNAAFLFPDLLFNILIAGGIAAAFVPIFSELLHADKKRAHDYANSILTAATGTMFLVAIVIIICAKPISAIVAPGFTGEDQFLVTKLLYVLALSPIFFAASNALGAILLVKRKFLFYGLSAILYNLGIICGTIFLAPHFGILGVAVGTLSGAVLHLLTRAFDIWRLGFRFELSYAFKTVEFIKTLKLMLPKMLGHPIELVTFWGFTAIASTLVAGSITIVNFARNFQSFSVSLIGITIATTSFPLLAHAMSEGKEILFWKTLKNSFIAILSLSTLSALCIFVIRKPLIDIFLGGGAFQSADINKTATTLGIFCLSIPTESLIHLLSRAFYATKNTAIPVTINVLGMLIAIPGGYYLSLSHGILALPFAFFLGSTCRFLLLAILLPIHMRKIVSSKITNRQQE